MKIAIVIPTYNERENIVPLLATLASVAPQSNVIVVDDGSPDGTADLIRGRAGVTLIERSAERGLGSALIAGFLRALADGADVVVEMDADGSHDPRELPKLVEAIEQGADLAIGSRRIPGGNIVGWSFARHAMSYGATAASRVVLGLHTRDVTNGFRAYRRQVLESIGLGMITSNGYAFQEEVLWRVERAGFRVVEVPSVFCDRTRGKSKLAARDVGEFFRTLIRLWMSR